MMTYRYADTTRLPAWLRDAPGPVWCKVVSFTANWDYRYIVWYTGTGYLDTRGAFWTTAEPVEVWEPEDGEPVIVWDDGDTLASVLEYRKVDSDWDRITRMPDFRLTSLDVKYIKSLRLEEVQR